MIDPLANPPAAVLALLSERTRYDGDGNRWFADEDGTPIIDIHEPGCPNAGPRAAARYLHSRRQELWAETKAAEAPAKPVATPANSIEAMAYVKAGTMSDADAVAFLHKQAAPVAKPTGELNFTVLMAKARAGDAAALAALQTMVRT